MRLVLEEIAPKDKTRNEVWARITSTWQPIGMAAPVRAKRHNATLNSQGGTRFELGYQISAPVSVNV